jgi:hypothetical protein
MSLKSGMMLSSRLAIVFNGHDMVAVGEFQVFQARD